MNATALNLSVFLSKYPKPNIKTNEWDCGTFVTKSQCVHCIYSLLSQPNQNVPLQWRHNALCLFVSTSIRLWFTVSQAPFSHYIDVIISVIASQITSLTIVYSTVYSGADQRKQQRPASLAFVRGIYRWPLNSPRKGPVTRKMFPFDDVIVRHRPFLIHRKNIYISVKK